MTSEARLNFGRAWIGDPSVGLRPEIQTWAQAHAWAEMMVEKVERLQAELAVSRDLAKEANAQTIKTQDQVLQTLVNLR